MTSCVPENNEFFIFINEIADCKNHVTQNIKICVIKSNLIISLNQPSTLKKNQCMNLYNLLEHLTCVIFINKEGPKYI